MKKMFMILCLGALFAACTGEKKDNASEDQVELTATDTLVDQLETEAEELYEKTEEIDSKLDSILQSL